MSTELLNISDGETSGRGRIRINPENPTFEWGRQSRMWANQVAERLGFSKEEYINTLPKFGPKPESFKDLGIPAVPMLVDPRVDLPDLLDILQISCFFNPQNLKDWPEGDFQTPREPYACWLAYIPNISVKDICADLFKHEDRRGGIPFDGVALYLRDAFLLNEYSLKFPGSRVGDENAPFLFALPNPEMSQRPSHPSLSRGSIDLASPKSACLIAGKV